MNRCPSCNASSVGKARYCASCGYALAEDSVTRIGTREANHALAAAIFIYVGAFASLFPADYILGAPVDVSAALSHQLITCLGFTAAGLLAVWRLGAGSFRESLAGQSSARQLMLGAAAGVAILAVNIVILTGLDSLLGARTAELEFGLPPALFEILLATAVLPALFEEWLCRGVLWSALRRLANARTTIALTAALFALLHGLNGAGLLELPTRFLLGLLVGWLRQRTQSLLPCIACHFVNNALAAFIL